MKRDVRIFSSPEELADACAQEFTGMVRSAQNAGNLLKVALSGGNTPKLFFSVLAEKYAASTDWNYVQFFWGDERCVLPDDPESNYGSFRDIFLDRIVIPCGNIHRIRGEDDPPEEASRYSEEIRTFTGSVNNLPVFDLIILGLGDDGHTASIFPGQMEFLNSVRICDVAIHPVSGQKRITLTGKVINNSRKIIFLIAGEKKASVVSEIIAGKPVSKQYPASYILPVSGSLIWMLDKKAGQLIM